MRYILPMEITKQLSLDATRGQILNNHSVLNVLNILQYNFLRLSNKLDNEKALLDSYRLVQELASSVVKRAISPEDTQKIKALHSNILSEVYGATENPFEVMRNSVKEIVQTIEKIVEVLDVRVDELVKQNEQGQDTWYAYNPSQLYDEFIDYLKAVEKNSGGAYSIVENISLKNDHSYFVDLKFATSLGEYIYMPLLVKDVLRDLISNARKYTDPGGNILLGVCQDEEYLRIVVEDNGRGIQEESIESVVDFGVRANNSLSKKSYGGGFGLTKAYYITKKFGGRMWIESELNYFTRIKVLIPLENK